MSTTNNKQKKVADLSLDEKKKLIAAEEQKDKQNRLEKFRKELQELGQKYNCTIIAQAIIEGNKVETRIVPMAL
jgi:hypothetical protein